MLPGEYNISIYQGDTFSSIAMITIPNLTSEGGPADLSGVDVSVSAQIRSKPDCEDTLAEFDIEILDAVERKIKPTISAEETSGITAKRGFWDLQVTKEGSPVWRHTILKGKVTFAKEVTRP